MKRKSGASEQQRWNRDAECFCRFKTDNQFYLHRRLYTKLPDLDETLPASYEWDVKR